MRKHVHVFASLGLLSTAFAAGPNEIEASAVLTSAVFPAQTAAPPVKAPDTPAGRALTEFVDSFNAGGKTRQTWLETRTTVEDEPRANLLKIDAQLLQKYGPLTVVRIASASQDSVAAVVRHGTSDRHGYLTIAVEPTAPHKVVNIGMRPATPEEIEGAGTSPSIAGRWERFLGFKEADERQVAGRAAVVPSLPGTVERAPVK